MGYRYNSFIGVQMITVYDFMTSGEEISNVLCYVSAAPDESDEPDTKRVRVSLSGISDSMTECKMCGLDLLTNLRVLNLHRNRLTGARIERP